jgi:CheY-like chemotaxis protein
VGVTKPAKILVVDDDEIVRNSIVLLLDDYAFHVITACDGGEGLRAFRQNQPDVLLTDIIMPEKDGIGLITEVRREFRGAKIIAMSGGGRIGNGDVLTVAAALGADACLQKPFDDLQLVKAVQSLLTDDLTAQPSAA